MGEPTKKEEEEIPFQQPYGAYSDIPIPQITPEDVRGTIPLPQRAAGQITEKFDTGAAVPPPPIWQPPPSAGPHNINDPVVRAAIQAGRTGEDLYDFEGRLGEKRAGTPEQDMLRTSTTVAGYGGGGGGQPFQPNDPSFKDLPFPLVEPYEYRALLQNRGMDPSAIEAEVGRYEAWRQTAPGLGDQIESDKVRSQQNAYGIEGERLGGLRAVGQQKIGAYEQMLPALQDVEAQRQKAWDDADRQYQDHLKAYDAEITDLHNTTINPTRIFDTNESNRALAAIAVGLGEFANQFTGHGNAALKIVSDAIDRDVEAQKAGVNTKYMALGVRSNLLNRLHDRFGDVNMAAQAAKAGMYEQLAMYTEYLGAQIGDKNVVAQAKKNAEELRALSVQSKLAFDLAAKQRADQQKAQANAWAYAASQSVQQSDADLAAQIMSEQEADNGAGGQEAGQWIPTDKDMRDRILKERLLNDDGTVTEFTRLAGTNEDRNRFATIVRTRNNITALFKLVEEGNKRGSQWFGSDPVQKKVKQYIEAARSDFVTHLQGKPSVQTTQTELDNLASAFTDMNNKDVFTSAANIRGRLEAVRDIINGSVARIENSTDPIKARFIHDPDTNQFYEGMFVPRSSIETVHSGYKPKKGSGKGKKEEEDTEKPAKGVRPFSGRGEVDAEVKPPKSYQRD